MNEYPNGRDLIILAMGPSRGLCPFDAETWGINQGYIQVGEMRGRLDKMFIAHSQVYSPDGNPYFNWEQINSLVDAGIEVINTHKVKGLKSKLFPFNRIVRKFDVNFFSDGICYMLVYALDQATYYDKREQKLKLRYPLKLRLYGVDMLDKDEYGTEKGGIEFWLGYAKGLGVKVEIAIGSTLLTTVTGQPYGKRLNWKLIDPLGLRHRKRTPSAKRERQIREKILGKLIDDLSAVSQ